MTIIQVIIAFGVAAGVLAILVVVTFDVLRKRLGDRDADPVVPKTLMGGIGIGGLVGPGALIARSGQNQPARMSLSTVILTPTIGLRVISLGGAAVILFLIWFPAMIAQDGADLGMHLLLSGLLGYGVIYISGYEARYDSEGITAPNWLFQDKHYPWEEFISIKDDGQYIYRLQFERGRMSLQKHLVGMPTFLTFASEIRELNARR